MRVPHSNCTTTRAPLLVTTLGDGPIVSVLEKALFKEAGYAKGRFRTSRFSPRDFLYRSFGKRAGADDLWDWGASVFGSDLHAKWRHSGTSVDDDRGLRPGPHRARFHKLQWHIFNANSDGGSSELHRYDQGRRPDLRNHQLGVQN